MANHDDRECGNGTGTGTGSGSECPPHDPDIEGGTACFEWRSGLEKFGAWNVVSSDCWAGFVEDEPDFDGLEGERVRTQCILDGGGGSGSGSQSSAKQES